MNKRGQLRVGKIEEECTKAETGPVPCGKTPLLVMTEVMNGHSELERTPLTNVKAIAEGGEAAYALLTDGHVVGWGGNDRGQLGTGLASPEEGDRTPFMGPPVVRVGGCCSVAE